MDVSACARNICTVTHCCIFIMRSVTNDKKMHNVSQCMLCKNILLSAIESVEYAIVLHFDLEHTEFKQCSFFRTI